MVNFGSKRCEDVTMLRIVLVVLINGGQNVYINVLLDDGSIKIYLNLSVAVQFGLRGKVRQVIVDVLNGQREILIIMLVECEFYSMDGSVNIIVVVFIIDYVIGDFEVINWNRKIRQWSYLKGLCFFKIVLFFVIDMLIGFDYGDFYYFLRDIRGVFGESIVRLILFGWICVGFSKRFC